VEAGADEAGADEAGAVDDGGGEDGGGSDEGGGEEGGGSEDGGGDEGGPEDGGGDDGGVEEGGAEDDGGLDEDGADVVGPADPDPDPDPDPEPPGWPGAELAGPEPGCVELIGVIGVGPRDALNLEPGGLRNALGDKEADGDALGPPDGPAARAGAVALVPAAACGWS
jgi:hypothetical protein